MTSDDSKRAPRVLITGAAGQDGFYLAEQLLAEGSRVFGLSGRGRAPASPGVVALDADMRDERSLRAAIAAARPDEIYNLAAVSFTPGAASDPCAADDVNAAGIERLAAAVVASGRPIRLCHASTAEIFGTAGAEPLDENQPLRPVTAYGKSKARAHQLVDSLRAKEGVFACSAILFNHESPRRPAHFVTRKITKAVARIARGLERRLTLGRLDAIRDWGYAPEYTDAMRRMVRADHPRDYVVATGRGASVEDFAALAFTHAGLDWRAHVVVDRALVRDGEADVRIGDPARIRAELGWKAATSLEELVAIMVDADLAALDRGH